MSSKVMEQFTFMAPTNAETDVRTLRFRLECRIICYIAYSYIFYCGDFGDVVRLGDAVALLRRSFMKRSLDHPFDLN